MKEGERQGKKKGKDGEMKEAEKQSGKRETGNPAPGVQRWINMDRRKQILSAPSSNEQQRQRSSPSSKSKEQMW